ncbi:MAG: magnesium/cobalt transporter CorA [Flavipsychrobacter sp.]|nr:magnesium/cobalt transporter CorA [Flavipsychrobacter sp.]
MAAARRTKNFLTSLLEWGFDYTQKKPITAYNPTRQQVKEHVTPAYTLYHYNADELTELRLDASDACHNKRSGDVIWLNIDGLEKEEVERISGTYSIHPLVVEDILSTGQRAKMDEIGDTIYCLLPMIYYNSGTGHIEAEQVSIVLGRGYVLSFQEDQTRDVFNPIREKLRLAGSKVRQGSAGYLCYALIDIIVDSYFGVLEKMNERIERLEENILQQKEKAAMEKIAILRREVMLLRRLVGPVRELVTGFLRSDSKLLEDRQDKYFKDVLDHITQANEYADAHRDLLINLQDVFTSQLNTKMNEVMKIFTMVATLLAPATVIGGIFGMNFDVIPGTHQETGFWWAVALMLLIPLLMLIWFKRKGWF